MEDREVLELTAELCGQLNDGAYGNWNPLTDANQAWQVLEAVRAGGDKTREKFWEGFWQLPQYVDDSSFRYLPAGVVLFEWGHFSDIPRAAAQAMKEQMEVSP